MNILLFILKVVGVVVAGFSTILGLFKHDVFATIEIPPLMIFNPTTPSPVFKRLIPKSRRPINLNRIVEPTRESQLN